MAIKPIPPFLLEEVPKPEESVKILKRIVDFGHHLLENSPPPANRGHFLGRTILWIKDYLQGLHRRIYYYFHKDQIDLARSRIKALLEESDIGKTPVQIQDEIAEIARPYAQIFPDFGFYLLTCSRSHFNIENWGSIARPYAGEIRYWGDRGYVLYPGYSNCLNPMMSGTQQVVGRETRRLLLQEKIESLFFSAPLLKTDEIDVFILDVIEDARLYLIFQQIEIEEVISLLKIVVTHILPYKLDKNGQVFRSMSHLGDLRYFFNGMSYLTPPFKDKIEIRLINALLDCPINNAKKDPPGSSPRQAQPANDYFPPSSPVVVPARQKLRVLVETFNNETNGSENDFVDSLTKLFENNYSALENLLSLLKQKADEIDEIEGDRENLIEKRAEEVAKLLFRSASAQDISDAKLFLTHSDSICCSFKKVGKSKK